MERSMIEELVVNNEWNMFQKVKGIDGRADCQDQYETFVIMRLSQFRSWDTEVVESYLQDLEDAKACGRNLVMEKYAHMMAQTDPDYYAQIVHLLPPVSDAVKEMAKTITMQYVQWEKEIEIQYPHVRSQGRPVDGVALDGTTSITNYLTCELYTYSEKTLMLFLQSILKKPELNRYKYSMEIMAKAYGYQSLDEAEKALTQ